MASESGSLSAEKERREEVHIEMRESTVHACSRLTSQLFGDHQPQNQQTSNTQQTTPPDMSTPAESSAMASQAADANRTPTDQRDPRTEEKRPARLEISWMDQGKLLGQPLTIIVDFFADRCQKDIARCFCLGSVTAIKR